jgi:hypothetical protein
MNQTLTIVSSTRLQTTPQTAWSTTATSTLLAAAVNFNRCAVQCNVAASMATIAADPAASLFGLFTRG